jgi:hypothetical protein
MKRRRNSETTERTEVVMQVLPIHRFTATNHVTFVELVLLFIEYSAICLLSLNSDFSHNFRHLYFSSAFFACP